MDNDMLAVRLTSDGLVEQRVAIPTPGNDEILVRIGAAGVCHSDAHYRDGVAAPQSLPVTLGHEVAGTVEAVTDGVVGFERGNRVALHYLVSCGRCRYCVGGTEQFCEAAEMIGKSIDGGFTEYISIPARNAVALPDNIPLEWGAVMMCSTATSYHAIQKARFQPGERVAVFGVGGLGLSAVQLLTVGGADRVFAVDLSPGRLELARSFGAIPINAAVVDPIEAIRDATNGAGVDISLELLGKRITIEQSLGCLAPMGRAAIVGITGETIAIDTYSTLIGGEHELIGVSDHLRSDLESLVEFAAAGKLVLSDIVTERVPLSAEAINACLDRLSANGSGVRSVVVPTD